MNKPDILLGVNIDHIATIRNARGEIYPDPVEAAFVAERAGADLITCHLREDRRHITDRDVELLVQTVSTRLNLECAITEEMLDIAVRLQPHDVCLVPEKREEVTTEGGLDVRGNAAAVKAACERLADAGIRVSLFIDPDRGQLDAAKSSGAPVIELHTGAYAHGGQTAQDELTRITDAADYGEQLGFVVNAGHGLHYHNVQPVAAIPCIRELNIGHAIIARSTFDGLDKAVRDMRALMLEARQ